MTLAQTVKRMQKATLLMGELEARTASQVNQSAPCASSASTNVGPTQCFHSDRLFVVKIGKLALAQSVFLGEFSGKHAVAHCGDS